MVAQLAPGLNSVHAPQYLPTGLIAIDFSFNGLLRGGITEIVGPASSGKTSLLLSTLAAATLNHETCALVDTNDCLDITSAVAANIVLHKLLWVRCAGNVEHAFKTVDLLLHGGGFGLVILDLADVPNKYTNRIVSSWWYRFRQTLEHTRTALLVVGQTKCARSAAAQVWELTGSDYTWPSAEDLTSSPTHSNLLTSSRLCLERRKPLSLTQPRVWLTPRMPYHFAE